MEGRESRDSLQAKGKRLWQVLLIWEGWSCTESCSAASAEKKSSCQIPSPLLCYTWPPERTGMLLQANSITIHSL